MYERTANMCENGRLRDVCVLLRRGGRDGEQELDARGQILHKCDVRVS